MRWSKYYLPTYKETPRDAEIPSHQLMLRAGLIKGLTSGVYSFLPAGLRVLQKVAHIVRDEMNSAGAQEVQMPVLHPGELYEETGRLANLMRSASLSTRSNRSCGNVGTCCVTLSSSVLVCASDAVGNRSATYSRSTSTIHRMPKT